MPVVPMVPVVPAPVHLIDHLIEGGRMSDGAAIRGRSRGRRRAGEGYSDGHQRDDEDCTHFNSP
jgi:hypothetical protein